MAAATAPTQPDQALDREDAVTAGTRGAASAEFAEHERGTLEVGKLADLAVLDQDVFSVDAAQLPPPAAC